MASIPLNKTADGVCWADSFSAIYHQFNHREGILNYRTITATLIAFFLLSGSMVHAATTLMEIGRSPFHQPPLTSPDSLVAMVKEKEAEIKRGLSLAGMPELFSPLMDQIDSVRIEETEFSKGSSFAWMLFKKRGKGAVRVARDVVWGAEKPFPAFQFQIEADKKLYDLVVPLGCGNLALLAIGDLISPMAKESNLAPQCSVVVTPTTGYCGEPVRIDALASKDSDGEIVGMTVTVLDSEGNTIEEQKIADGLIAETSMPCGPASIRISLTDDDGETATSEACSVDVEGRERVGLVLDLGYYNMPDPGNYLFGRIGLEYEFSENWSVLGLVGGAPHISGIDGTSALLVDFLGEYSWKRFYIDLGVGGWISDGDQDLPTENSQLDLIAGIGARVYGEPDEFNASLFAEMRAATDELDDFISYGRFGFGVRLRF